MDGRRRPTRGAEAAREAMRRRRAAEAAREIPEHLQGDVVHEVIHEGGDLEDPPKIAATATENESEWPVPIPLGQAPAVPPFPLEVLPAPVRQLVEECAWASNTPPDFTATACLAVVAGAIGGSRRLAITRSHHQPTTLWAAIVGRPGSGKSSPFQLVKEPLEQAERRYYRQWERAKEEWEEDCREPADKGPKPRMRRQLFDDATGEALVRGLAENPRGLLLARDELTALVCGMDQYKEGGKGSERQCYLSIWGGSTIKIDRVHHDGVPTIVRRPCLSICGTIQPAVIERLRGDPRGNRPAPDDGFFDRFLVSYPVELSAIGEQWREVSEAAAERWRLIVDQLLDLELVRSEDGDLLPGLVRFRSCGRTAWEGLTQRHADEVNAPEFDDWLRGPWAKLVPGYAGRLALVIQMLRWACHDASGEEVDGESVEAAEALIVYFKAHSRKVYAAMAADPRVEAAYRVLFWLARRQETGRFTRRDVYRDLRCSFRRPEDLEPVLRRLVESGHLLLVDAQGASGGRRPSQEYLVNPGWDRTPG